MRVAKRPGCVIGGMLLLGLVAGCSTMQAPDAGLSPQEVVDQIAVGDPVEVKTETGAIRAFHVTAISPTHIEGEHEKFALDQVEIVAHRDVTLAEKGTAVAAVVTVAVLVEALFWAVFLGIAL